MQECKYIRSVVPEDAIMHQFLSDETLKRAVTRSLEIIGEATKKVPADIKYQWQEISWRQMAGMRDKLIHDYMGANYLIVWDVAKNIIPILIPQIEAIIAKSKVEKEAFVQSQYKKKMCQNDAPKVNFTNPPNYKILKNKNFLLFLCVLRVTRVPSFILTQLFLVS